MGGNQFVEDPIMKKRNFHHFIECLLLSPLFFFLAFFLRMQGDLFFIFTVIFTSIAVIGQIGYLYIVGDSDKEHLCHLVPLDVSDILFIYYLLQIAFATVFTVIRNLNGFSPWTAFSVYFILLLLAALFLFFPELKEPIPTPDNEVDEVTDKRLQYYASYLIRLCRKCQYAPLTQIMTEIAEILPRINCTYSVQLQVLDNDLSAKCVKIENALLTGDHSRLPVLTRELEASLAHIQKRLKNYHYILTDEGFCKTDDEIANAQIDLLLDKLGLEFEDDLPTLSSPFADEFFYQKALLFATDEYKALLAGYNQQIIDRIAAETLALQERRDHNLRYFRRFSHILAVGLISAVVIIPLLWHFVIQPQGLLTVPDEQGNLIISGYNPFYGDELTIPAKLNGKKVIAVGRDALNGIGLTALTVEEGIERLEFQAICNNEYLTDLSLPSSLKSIGHFAFYKLDSLSIIHYAGNAEQWKAIEKGVNGNKQLENAQIKYGK